MRSIATGTRFGFVTDLGYATKMVVERLRKVHTRDRTNHDERCCRMIRIGPAGGSGSSRAMAICRTRRLRL